MEIFVYIIVFALGLAFGSFINMAVWRIHHSESFAGRSYCDKTKKLLGMQDLIPFFSFILYKGRCRQCGKKLPLVYPIVELLTGLLFVLTSWKILSLYLVGFEFVINLIIAEIFIVFFVFFAVYDYLYWEVDLFAVLLAIGIGVVLHIISVFTSIAILPGFVDGIIGGVVGALVIWILVVVTKKSGMGEGDIFLYGLTGLLVGVEAIYWAFMITVLSGSIVGIVKAVKNKKIKGVLIQFGPFISFGAIITFLFRLEILHWIYEVLFSAQEIF